jgi:hypothetical protein
LDNFDELDAAARAAYAAYCANDPLEPMKEPNWGRGGYKTEVVVWHAVANAVLEADRAVEEKEDAAHAARIAADPFGRHEALHAAHIAQEVFNSHVAEHPAVTEVPKLAALAEKCSEALMDLYQAIGQHNYDKDMEGEGAPLPDDQGRTA